MKRERADGGQQGKRHTEGKRSAKVTFGPRKACGLHPSHLMLKRGNQAGVQDDVIDGVVAERNFPSVAEGLVAEHEVVGAVIGGHGEASDLAKSFCAESHGRTQYKTHPLHFVGDQDSGGHFDRHADSFKACPEATFRGDAAIEAGHCANGGVSKRCRNSASVIGRNAHIAVTDDKNGTMRSVGHDLHRLRFGIDVARFSGREKAGRNMGKTCGDATSDGQPFILFGARAEEDFIVWIILLKEGGEVGLESRFCSVQRFEQAERWGELSGQRLT